jgi:hypothetical protein
MNLFRRGPEHCSMCGDAFIEAEYSDEFRRDGTPIVRRWRKCPRSDDYRPSTWERYQLGRCTPPHPFICANQRRAWDEHRPWWNSCGHDSVSEDGSACWAKDGRQLTGTAEAVLA